MHDKCHLVLGRAVRSTNTRQSFKKAGQNVTKRAMIDRIFSPGKNRVSFLFVVVFFFFWLFLLVFCRIEQSKWNEGGGDVTSLLLVQPWQLSLRNIIIRVWHRLQLDLFLLTRIVCNASVSIQTTTKKWQVMTCEPHIQMKCVTLLLLLLLLLSALAVASENPVCHVYVRVRYCSTADAATHLAPHLFSFVFLSFSFGVLIILLLLLSWPCGEKTFSVCFCSQQHKSNKRNKWRRCVAVCMSIESHRQMLNVQSRQP